RPTSPNGRVTMDRPASVTVFGILNIVFAGFGVVGMLVGTIMLFAAPGAAQNPVTKLMQDSPAYVTWAKLSLPLALLACAASLAAGIGLLLLKEWARKLAIGYAICAIVM